MQINISEAENLKGLKLGDMVVHNISNEVYIVSLSQPTEEKSFVLSTIDNKYWMNGKWSSLERMLESLPSNYTVYPKSEYELQLVRK